MLNYDPATGIVANARQVESPNCDARPESCPINLIVVHGISLPPGEFGGPFIDDLFTNKLDSRAHPYFEEIADAKVSAHFLIRRDGELVQYVSVLNRAWHAGQSCYDGREACNDYSVGIELEGEDDRPYSDDQYDRLAELVRVLRDGHSELAESPIVGHSDIAPDRKTDPGPAFDWAALNSRLADA